MTQSLTPNEQAGTLKLANAGSGVRSDTELGDGTQGLMPQEIPTAVTVKPVLAMIKAHLAGEPRVFKQNAMTVARELELMGKTELSEWIYAQYGETRTFEVTDR